MNKFQAFLLTMLGVLSSGCAVTSGIQTHDLPVEGRYQTELGTAVELVRLTQTQIQSLKAPNVVSQPTYASLFSSRVPVYQLQSGDTLSIQLWAYPEITPPTANITTTQAVQAQGYRIDLHGNIQFPLIGQIKASGKTLQQFTQDLQQRLSRYLKKPDAVVRILSFESQRFSVLGNVVKNGQYFLNDQPLSVYAALGLAGGLQNTADNSTIQLVRRGVTYDLNLLEMEKNGYSLHHLYIQPNDTLYIRTRDHQKVYVMGESGKNQAIILREQGMTLSDVLGESLGLNPISASAKRIYVLRNQHPENMTYVYHMDLSNFGDFGLANQFQIKSNDIIYVDATGLTRWQRIVNQVIPFSNALYNIDRMGSN